MKRGVSDPARDPGHEPGPRKAREQATEGEQVISRQMAEAFFRRIKQIKETNPETTALIDRQEREIARRLHRIRDAISKMTEEEADLVTILVINGIHKAAEDILLDEA